MITKRCLTILIENAWPFTVQTRSSLVLRDIEILKRGLATGVQYGDRLLGGQLERIFQAEQIKPREGGAERHEGYREGAKRLH